MKSICKLVKYKLVKITNLKYYIMPYHNLCVPTVGFAPTPSFTCDMVAYQRHNAAYCRIADFPSANKDVYTHLGVSFFLISSDHDFRCNLCAIAYLKFGY